MTGAPWCPECGPTCPLHGRSAENDAAEVEERARCGVTFRHPWHGFVDLADYGRTNICDGEPRVTSPELSVIWEDHERDMRDPEYRAAFEEATRVLRPVTDQEQALDELIQLTEEDGLYRDIPTGVDHEQ